MTYLKKILDIYILLMYKSPLIVNLNQKINIESEVQYEKIFYSNGHY